MKYLLAILTIFPLISLPASSAGRPGEPETQYILRQINAVRAKYEVVKPVIPSRLTCQYAKRRAKEVAADFSHEGFMQSAWEFYRHGELATENLAYNFSSTEEMVEAWEKSPGHLEVLLADTPYMCAARFEKHWALEGWKP